MIEVKDLSFSYGSEAVLEHVNLALEPGIVYGLLGPNGAGKTTLLTLLCGLKNPGSGSISIDGNVPFERKPSFLSKMYFLPDNVAAEAEPAHKWARRNGEFRPGFSFERFSVIMEEFKTSADRKLNAMSWGQLKKTHIAYALACKPRYLLMDEPTNGLDIPSKIQFGNIMSAFNGSDTCVLISTHQLKEMEDLFEQVILLDGKHAEMHSEGKGTYSNLFL